MFNKSMDQGSSASGRDKEKKPMPKWLKQIIHCLVFILICFAVILIGIAIYETCCTFTFIHKEGGLGKCIEIYGFSEVIKGFIAPWAGIFKNIKNTDLGSFLWILIFCIIVYLIFIRLKYKLLYKLLKRCRGCNKLLAMQKMRTKAVSEEDISVLTEVKSYNLDRDVIGTNEQYIPGTRTTYCTTYKCKYCGYEENKYSYKQRMKL